MDSVITPHHPQRSGRVGPLATGAALAGAAVLVAVNDPAATGSRFPPCGFHLLTGWWCPGCGLTRATHHLLRGDVAAALGSNVFTPIVLLAIVAAWFTWTRRSFGLAPGRIERSVVQLQAGSWRWSGAALFAAMVLYAVLRNVPAAPFDAWAP